LTREKAARDDLHPPLALLDFPPLAHLMNDWLRALNDLSACVQLSSAQAVARKLGNECRNASEVLASFLRRERDARPSAVKVGVNWDCSLLRAQE
jgi:hypothetical protein